MVHLHVAFEAVGGFPVFADAEAGVEDELGGGQFLNFSPWGCVVLGGGGGGMAEAMSTYGVDFLLLGREGLCDGVRLL